MPLRSGELWKLQAGLRVIAMSTEGQVITCKGMYGLSTFPCIWYSGPIRVAKRNRIGAGCLHTAIERIVSSLVRLCWRIMRTWGCCCFNSASFYQKINCSFDTSSIPCSCYRMGGQEASYGWGYSSSSSSSWGSAYQDHAHCALPHRRVHSGWPCPFSQPRLCVVCMCNCGLA